MLAMLSVFACAKVEIVSVDDPIDFSWYARRSTGTKADASLVESGSTNLPIGGSFGVFGYFHAQQAGVAGSWGDGVENSPNLLYNEQVTIGGSVGNYTYTYTNSRWWPKNTLDRISFFAYYPYQNHLNTDGSANADAVVEPVLDHSREHDGMVSFNYQVKPNAADHIDLLISDLCMDQSKKVWDGNHSKGLTGTANGKVKFDFHHALSLVRVKAVNFDASGNTDVTMTVDEIKFNGIYVYGNCLPTLGATDSNTGRTTITETWSNLNAKRPGESDPTGITAHIAYNSSSDTWDSSKYMLMIPHSAFPMGASISVKYSLTRSTDGQTGERYEYTGNVLMANLASPSCSSWLAGKIYTYTITLNLKAITIDASVEDWLTAGEDVFMEETTTP